MELSSNAWIIFMFLYAIKYLDISYAPPHLPRTLTYSAPNKKAIYNLWTYLGLQNATLSHPLFLPSDAPLTSQCAVAITLCTALANDCNVEWTIIPLHLSFIKLFFNKVTLLFDFATLTPFDAVYINDTFYWV